MASYLVGVVKKHDFEKYGEYAAAGFRLIDGVKVEVAFAEDPEVLEGEFPGTTIIIMNINILFHELLCYMLHTHVSIYRTVY